jgi:DMSO/TMAO reductase YedYZ molybdopterin-dependent catalytic subunit
MHTNKHILGYLLILTSLIGCTRKPTVVNVPSEITEESALALIVTPTPPDKAILTSTISHVITPIASQTHIIATLQYTESAIFSDIDVIPVDCHPEPVTQPPQTANTFQPNEFDSENGLHVTGSLQWIELATYRLKVTGLVDHPLSLTYDYLRCMPNVTDNPKLVCPGVFTDYATWTGVPIRDIVKLAGVQSKATYLTLVSADGYQIQLPIETALRESNFLAYQVNGKPLPIQHGFPLRAVFPDMWGSYWLKWLIEIRIS